ncbi:MAG: tyrosine-type recombinase/integrase, partial [Alphaproteobacteria bacterium]|nr:tyrosine-type recombinase/integrase [Alphaproteobacteria bacterium]
KSSAGARKVPAGPMVLNTLKLWRGARIVRPDALVFPANPKPQPNQWSGKEASERPAEGQGGVQSHANILHRDFYPLFAKLTTAHTTEPEKHSQVARFRWHDLRHFAISLWIEQGFNVKEIMTFAGHADYAMTMQRYGHLFPKEDHQRGMAEIEAKLFK